MTTVLLTGATSFIGRYVAKHLAQSGLRVVATYRTANRGLTEALVSCSPTLELIQLDISDDVGFNRLPSSIDAVVHVAGVSPVPDVSVNDMLAVNVTGTRNVQRYAVRAGARKFIYCSSLSIHGRIEADVVDAHTPIIDPETYGATKYLGERMLASVSDTIPTLAIRLPGVLGPGAHRAWIPTLVERLVAGQDVSVYSPNAGFNNAVHVSDLSRFIAVILLGKVWRGFSAFPVGASGEMTIMQVVNLLREKVGSVSKLCEGNIVKPSFLIDSSHAIECFGYVPARIDMTLLRYLEDLETTSR